ncbi:MAG: phosphodiester glycosidase family protein [Deltaproteobacteria bacterium]|nr:phosphodiester glycosidase family protein [Deltaproteobacteria bacterium]MBW1920108.1 phosphodiester glycosidase family protein [Deltaproteobacteria bacterium]MBW1936188.1 phosphodiester glycosidase family protein [Deltaproteobacteria bacterium]MBW1979046.1 phosphodiester glycosidase family protein [Deltaproteobacteria bacterium]MBW2043614.1 phosphodiester glycosidase family protein [Deltaproteobacteria bacterium]
MNTEMASRKKIYPRWAGVFAIVSFLLLARGVAYSRSDIWEKLDTGLCIASFDPVSEPKSCKGKITILKIDPAYYSFELLCASEHGQKSRTLRQWAQEFSLVAAINAGMYQDRDFLRNIGYMRNYRHINNGRISKKLGAFFVFNPVDATMPAVQMVDTRSVKGWRNIIARYHSVVQSYRMIANGEKKGWPQKGEIFCSAAVGMDRDGHVLFMLSQSLLSVHDLINELLSLPVHITEAMYVEGGPQAALYFKRGAREITLIGVCTNDRSRESQGPGFEIPNVIGIKKKIK